VEHGVRTLATTREWTTRCSAQSQDDDINLQLVHPLHYHWNYTTGTQFAFTPADSTSHVLSSRRVFTSTTRSVCKGRPVNTDVALRGASMNKRDDVVGDKHPNEVERRVMM
jgi:hypothetical protein